MNNHIRMFVLLLLMFGLVNAIELIGYGDAATKLVQGVNVTTDQIYNNITPDNSTHYYLFQFAEQHSFNVRITPSWIERRVGANVLDVNTYPVSEFSYFNITQNETNISTRHINVTYSDASRLDTRTIKDYLIAITTPNWETWSWNISIGAIDIDPDVTACGELSSPSSLYTLTQNISVNDATCLTIAADHIDLDCDGYTIQGNNASVTRGVVVGLVLTDNVTVRNCNILNFSTGIYVFGGGDRVDIINNTINVSHRTSCSTTNGECVGVWVDLATDVIIQNNSINSQIYALSIDTQSSGAQVRYNNITASDIYAVTVGNAEGGIYEHNNITASTNFVISIRSGVSPSNGNTFKNNTLTSSGTVIHWLGANDGFDNRFVQNNITGTIWADVDDAGNFFNDSSGVGNRYWWANGTEAWEVLNIFDTNSDGWADLGSDRPFSSTTIPTEWITAGNDSHPYTENELNLSRIDPTPTAVSNEDLLGYCNIPEQFSPIQYNYTWYKDDVEFVNGTFGNFTVTTTEFDTEVYFADAGITNPDNANDTDFDTFASNLVNNTNKSFEWNYTNPTGSINETEWMVRHGTSAVYNTTLPLTCASEDPIQVMVWASFINYSVGGQQNPTRDIFANTAEWNNPSNADDGNDATFADCDTQGCKGNTEYLYWNYTPVTTVSSATLEVKHGDQAIYNITLGSGCYSEDPIQIRAFGTRTSGGGQDYTSGWHCWGGASWTAIGTDDITTGTEVSSYVYEQDLFITYPELYYQNTSFEYIL